MKRVAIVGTSGFTGKECLRLLANHPGVKDVILMSARDAPSPPTQYRGALAEPPSQPFDAEVLTGLDAVFVCAPHDASAALVPLLLERVHTVIDLSAAFRLSDPALYPLHYGFAHPAPMLLASAVYGLPELGREALRDARLIANPGCYVTSVVLPVRPLLEAHCIAQESDIIADCKSGVSGAGKASTAVTHFASAHDDFRAYAVGTHRHEPEIREQTRCQRVYFTPHLLPLFRGILSTIHIVPGAGVRADDIRAALRDRYASERFVRVLAEDAGLPCIADVRQSNGCAIGVAQHGDRVVVVSCIDNLIKGAAGQAIQNFNVAFGLDEAAGLPAPTDERLQGWS